MDVDQIPDRKDPDMKAKVYSSATSIAVIVMLVEALGAGMKWG